MDAIIIALIILIGVAARAQDKRESDSSPSRQVSQEQGTTAVDFKTQIWPILQAHCLKCHGPEKQKGELRLDDRSFVQAGGHTGNAILADRPETSELYLRVTSEDPKYRMPATGPPLSQDQIELIRQWIAEGAAWTDVSDGFPEAPPHYGWIVWAEPYLVAFEKAFDYVRPIAIPLLVLLVGVIWVERAKRRFKRKQAAAKAEPSTGEATRTLSQRSPSFAARIRREWYLVCGLALGLVGLWSYYQRQTTAQQKSLRRLAATIAELNAKDEVPVQHGPNGGPVPPRPKHVKQLGGTYYRGNDERDSKLFNGGFYRTATMRVHLTGNDKRPLQWGDEIQNGPLFVTLEIERAKQATPALFTDAILKTIFMSRQVALLNRPESADEPSYFEVVVPRESWVSHYRVGESSENEDFSGMIYVYKGREEKGVVEAKFHYGISYRIQIADERISEDSEIWMGSLSVPAGMLIPPADRMVLNEWFDFRPLPEIEGANATDPALLGIPEYER